MRLKLVLFDVDGTLIDSQAQIVAAMARAFAAEGLSAPPARQVRGIIGLSLPNAIAKLAPQATDAQLARMVAAYKEAYVAQRVEGGGEGASPLFPGALAALQALGARDEVLLGVATGKSRRGLNHLFDTHGLGAFFVTTQVADDHPSKPHPSMVLTALAETGVEARDAVILGDTSYDMDMGRAGGIAAFGVNWGYHPAQALHDAGAVEVLSGFDDLLPALDRYWGASA